MNDTQAKTDRALAALEGLADKWAEDVNLTAMIKNAVSPMRLNRNAPDDVREKFTGRMEAQIDAIARQAFIEGAYRAVTGMQDEHAAMRATCPVCFHGEGTGYAGRPPCLEPFAGSPEAAQASQDSYRARGCLYLKPR